jgi:formimidoylglutamate deiminase
VLDRSAPALLGVPDDHLLDALVFSSPDARPAQVHVAGRRVVSLASRPDLVRAMSEAMKALWSAV